MTPWTPGGIQKRDANGNRIPRRTMFWGMLRDGKPINVKAYDAADARALINGTTVASRAEGIRGAIHRGDYGNVPPAQLYRSLRGT